MTFKKLFLVDWPLLLLIALSLAAGWFVYPHLPPRIPVHWGLNGQPNGYGPPWMGAFFGGLLALGVYLLFAILPLVDPRRRNYESFRPFYRLLRWLVVLFLLLLGALTMSAGLGDHPPVKTIVPLGVSLLIVLIGNFLGKVKPNWFVGIRTPWTLSSEEVWRRTHRFAAPLWVAGGIAMLVSAFLPGKAQVVAFFGVFTALVVLPILQSCILWARQK